MTLIENKQQRLINFQDGRRLPNDDLRAIQRQLDNLSMLFAGWGAFVLTGCEVTVNSNNNSLRDIAEGLVYLNDHLIYFPGVTGLDLSSSMYMVEISSMQLAPRGYVLSGTTEEGLMEYRVDMLSSKPGSGEYIEFQESGAQRTKASDLDLPQAVIDIANLQANKADKVTSPISSYIRADTQPGFNDDWDNGTGNKLIYWKDNERKRVYFTGSITSNPAPAASGEFLITQFNYALPNTPLTQPVFYLVYNSTQGKMDSLYLSPNGELYKDSSISMQDGDILEIPLYEYPTT